MKPKTQLTLDEFGYCTSKNCMFRSQCAQHHSAGDFRIEDGFRPEIEPGAGTSELFCVTFGEAPLGSTNFPGNATFLEVGSYSLTELAQLKESVTKKVSVTDSEYSAKEMQKLAKETIDKKTKNELSTILEEIKKIAKRGELNAVFDMTRNPNRKYIMNALKSLGYNVRIIGSADWDYEFGRASSKEMYVSW